MLDLVIFFFFSGWLVFFFLNKFNWEKDWIELNHCFETWRLCQKHWWESERLMDWPDSQLLAYLIFCQSVHQLSCQLDSRLVGWLQTRRLLGFWACLLPRCPCLAGEKLGQLLKLPPIQLAFLSSPESSLSCSAVQDA